MSIVGSNNKARSSTSSLNSSYNPSFLSASASMSMSTTKYSFISVALMSFCIWSAVMVIEPIQCRTMVRPMVKESQTILNNDGKIETKSSINDHRNQARLRPLEACQELLADAVYNSAKNADLAELELVAILKDRIRNISSNGVDDYFDDYDSISKNGKDNFVDQDGNDEKSHQLDHSEAVINIGSKQYPQITSASDDQLNQQRQQFISMNTSDADQQRNRHLWIKLMKQCMEMMSDTFKMHDQAYPFRNMKNHLRWLAQEKKSWLADQSGTQMDEPPSTVSSYATNLDFFWKDLGGIRFKKQGGKIIRIHRKSTEKNRVSKKKILLLLNVSIAKPLLEKLHRRVADSNVNVLNSIPKSLKYRDHLRPLTNSYLHLFRPKSSPSDLILDEADRGTEVLDPLLRSVVPNYLHSMFRVSNRQTVPIPSTIMAAITLTSPIPIESGLGQSKLVETKAPEMEEPRSKKVLSKKMILRSDPWDKEGIRFKRSSNKEFDQLKEERRRANEHYISAFDIFGQEGIRFKKSPFDDDEGIRYKKSVFDDEGIRYKKSVFDDEGIRYKKSVFDDEGIRYKKSPFDDEHIRY